VHDDEHLLILGDGHGSLLALSHGDPPAAHLPRTNHFGFRLPAAADVLTARERFQAAGDPDGYRVEVYAF
jgi:hypothetical protein